MKRSSIAWATVSSLIFGLFFAVPVAPALANGQPGGSGLAVEIRPDSRSLAWVKSQGFEAWGETMDGASVNCFNGANQALAQNWGTTPPSANCPADNFVAHYSGFILAAESGDHLFRVLANDAFELRINGQQVLRNWNSTAAAGSTLTTNVALKLEGGVAYPIDFFYRDFTKEAHFKVSWRYPGSGDFAQIPTANLDDQISDLVPGGQIYQCSNGIGLSADCPAYSPQEIFDIHGTTQNGEYWLLVAGVATKVHVYMAPEYAGNDGAGYVQLMWIGASNGGGYTGLSGSGARFNYDSPLWTDQLLTLNSASGITTTSKRNTYNFTPVNKVMAIFPGASNFSNFGPDASSPRYNTGAITGPNSMDFHWVEDVPEFAAGEPAISTFDNRVPQTESVIEPVDDRNPSAGLRTSSKSVGRVKITISDSRKEQILGQLNNRYWHVDNYSLSGPAIQAPKTGVFSAAKNPYNEWYGFNFKGREWADSGTDSTLKMRWGFFSMAYQEPINYIIREYNPFTDQMFDKDVSGAFRNNKGEQAPSSVYQPFPCNSGGCGSQLYFASYAPMTRYLSIGGIGLADSNAAAFQPRNLELAEVELTGGNNERLAKCHYAPPTSTNLSQRSDAPLQTQKNYNCAYTTGLYGQMPNPSLPDVTGVTATETAGGFNLTWSAVAGATEYIVSYNKGGGPATTLRVQSAQPKTVFIPESGPGTYSFKVTARKFTNELVFDSSGAPATTTKEVGVGLGGSDTVLAPTASGAVDLDQELGSNPIAVSGLLPQATVGVTITLNSGAKSLTLGTIAGLFSDPASTIAVTPAEQVLETGEKLTFYGTAAAVNSALADLSYEHLDPANPTGEIKVEAYDAGSSTVIFNPNNQHYYSVNRYTVITEFRDAYCRVITGGDSASSTGYANCNPPASGQNVRQNYNGVNGYPATITSADELRWLAEDSGLLSFLTPATSIGNSIGVPSESNPNDDIWIGGPDLLPTASGTDKNYQWVVSAPTAESGQTFFTHTGTGLRDTLITGVKIHARNDSKASMTILRTNIAGYPEFILANADSGQNDNVRAMLVEYSGADGKNPLYKSRTISFALEPEITSTPVSTPSSRSATLTFGVDPKNAATTIEVSFRKSGSGETEWVSAALTSATRAPGSSGPSTATLSGLEPNTEYEYEVRITSAGGEDTSTGVFKTAAAVPTVLAASAEEVTHNSATLGASIRTNADALSSIAVQLSTNGTDWSAIPSQTIDKTGFTGNDAQTARATFSGLTPATTYYFRTQVTNSAGTTTSESLSFETAKDLSAITTKIDDPEVAATLGNRFEIRANHPSEFPANFSVTPGQDTLYASYTIKNISASDETGVWVELQDFVGGAVEPLEPANLSRFVGTLKPNESATVYFPLKATRATEVDQQHVVSVTNGKPGTDADNTPVQLRFIFDAVIDTSSSGSQPNDSGPRITDVRFNTSAPSLGGEFRVTTTGNTGDSDGDIYFNPIGGSDFPFDSLRLERVELNFPNVSGGPNCPATVTNSLLLTNPCYQNQNFEAVSTFRVVDTPAESFNLTPSIGTELDGELATLPRSELPPTDVNLRPQDTTTVKPSVSSSSSDVDLNGTPYEKVEVTLDIDSTSIRSSELDAIEIELGAGAIFDLDSTELTIDGVSRPVNATLIDSTNNTIRIDGPIPSSALRDVKVTFDVLVPPGTPIELEASGQIGDNKIGSTADSNTKLTVTAAADGTVGTSSSAVPDPATAAATGAGNVFQSTATLIGKVERATAGNTLQFRFARSSNLTAATIASASPATAAGKNQETFSLQLTELVPGSTYFYQAVFKGVATGPILSFTTRGEDEPFVGLRDEPLPSAVICDEPELNCEPISIKPPTVACDDCKLTYQITSGSLPEGLTLNPNTGEITGTPSGSGGNSTFNLTVTAARDGQESTSATQTYNLVTAPATAEPQAKSLVVGNISDRHASLTTKLAFVPAGELIRVNVSTIAGSPPTVLVDEVIAEGLATASQLVIYKITGLSPDTEYSVRVFFGPQNSNQPPSIPELASAVARFSTSVNPVVPAMPMVTDASAVVENDKVTLSTTLENPLAGDSVGFVVSTSPDLTGGFSVSAGSASADTVQTLTTEVANLDPGTYFYRVVFGDFTSSSILSFRVNTSADSSVSGGITGGVQVTSVSSRVLKSCEPTILTINGSKLAGSSVEIQGVPVKVLQSSDTALVVEVPAGLSPGKDIDLVIRSNSGTLTLQGALEIALTTCRDASAFGFWTKRMSTSTVKFYAKNPIGEGKIQFFANGREIAWIRAADETDRKLSFASGYPYLTRNFTLQPGKNRLEIWVNGKRLWRVTYVRR